MVISPEQAEQVKQHLLGQLDSFPEDQRENIKNKIMSMTAEEVETFVKQNQLGHLDQGGGEQPDGGQAPQQQGECIFCAITEGKIPSYILEENKDNLVILEINPISKGHALVVPRKHLELDKIPSSAFILAKKLVQRIGKNLQPLEIKLNSQKIMGHSVLEVLPLYGNESERKKASEQELQELQRILKAPEKIARINTSKKTGTKKSTKKKAHGLVELKPRIP